VQADPESEKFKEIWIPAPLIAVGHKVGGELHLAICQDANPLCAASVKDISGLPAQI
jgi:hypothetical protein